MRPLLLGLILLAVLAPLVHAADTWAEYAPFAKSVQPLPPTPMGDGHLGLVESGKMVQLRFPVSTPLPVAYRVNLANVVAFTGKGTAYQLLIRRDKEDGPVVYEGPVVANGDDWNATNREAIDLTAGLKPEDAKTGYVDLFVTARVEGDGWTVYRFGGGRQMAALAVTLTPEMEQQIAAGKAMEKLGIALLPLPKECVMGEGRVAVGTTIEAKGMRPAAALSESLSERLAQLGVKTAKGLPVRVSVAKATGQVNGYTLSVAKAGISIIGDDAPGVFYGVQTLCQLMRKGPDGGVQAPALQIRDWPTYPLRGFQYDIARGQTVDLDYCKRMIREAARYKMNAIMYYLEDDYQFEKYPFTGRPGTFTKAKAQELSRYADQYYVMLIPQYESLGHAGAVLSHPEFKDLREGNSSWVFCTNEPKVWQFLDDAYAELAEAFPNSKYLHVGGDEFEGPFGTCPRCRAIRDKDGIGALYVLHMNKLNELCKKYKRTMMFWPSHRGPSEEESYLTLKNADKMQRDCIPTEWIYHGPAAYPEIEQYQKAGFKDVCVSPAVESYSRILPDHITTFRAIKGFYQAGADRGCGIALCTTWEFMTGALIENSMYGLTYCGEVGWSLGQGTRLDYNRRFAANWWGNTDPQAAQLIDDAIYLPLAPGGPASFWRDGRLSRQIFWAAPGGFRREIMQRNATILQHASELDQAMQEALDKVALLRKNATRNTITLDFQELALRMMRYNAAKLTAFEKAAQAYAQARAAQTPEAAKAALSEAAAALKGLRPELGYCVEKFTFAVEKCGAWDGDLKSLKTQQQGLEAMVGRLEGLAAALPAPLPTGEELGLGLKPYTLVARWEPAQMGEQDHELRFDVSAAAKAAGTYRFEFSYTHGAHALVIEKVQLLKAGQVIAEDIHHGHTGASNSGNSYLLKIDPIEPGQKYELVATVRSSGGNDSNGDLWMSQE